MADLYGEHFDLKAPSEYALMEFAEGASEDEESLAGLAAVMRLLRAIVDPKDWKRFSATCRTHGATVEHDLMPMIVEATTARPTEEPAGSSSGPSTTPPRFGSDSESKARAMLPSGRGDLHLMVHEAARSA